MSTMLIVTLPLVGIIVGFLARWIYAKNRLFSLEQKALMLKEASVAEAKNTKKEIILAAQNKILEDKREFEREIRKQRSEIQRYERRIQQKEDNLDLKISEIDKRRSEQKKLLEENKKREVRLANEEKRWQSELERVSSLSVEDAKKLLMQSIENEAKHDALALVNKFEQEAVASAEKNARNILTATMQRIATEVTTEISVTSVSLPNDEMKGRIIGREGRNIRALETLTGVDIIIDDTPEAVVISCFDPIRKTIAKIALERLIQDGRIHPVRIEEIVQKVTAEINQMIHDEGERVLFDLGIHGVRPECIRALGRLHFRTSYGQNVLAHSKEVSVLAGMLASEIGVDVAIAKRAALLHDIGKGLETDSEGGHAEIGADFARRMGEDPRVVNAIIAHHNDEEITSPEGVIVQLADAISAARPGARREILDNYIKRLENLEKIAMSFEGVEKVFAIQAGRELRIMVNHTRIDDQQTRQLAKDIARDIELQLKFPGKIRVTIIRETRVVEYAR
ncbi:ribonuclease Y [Olavius algarvensis spirochete endosymbiont]|uniref:ribonuclease Y n=1 Tax=Olavius algarvensis spirochete endosymbiont TaxID=260710 RepID=UPI000F519D2F|nr:ribonuclease Y [Olavius algarvensis spirochete endosymbiont]